MHNSFHGCSYLFLFFLLFFSIANSHCANKKLYFTEKIDGTFIAQYCRILEDKKNRITINDLITSPGAFPFNSINDIIPNYGYVKSTYWVKLNLKNSTNQDKELILIYNRERIGKEIDFYILDQNQQLNSYSDHYLIPELNKGFHYRYPAFHFNLKKNEEKIIYARFKVNVYFPLPLILWSSKKFYSKFNQEQLIFGIEIGIIIIMILYNLFLIFALRDKSYIYYILFIIANGLTITIMHGLFFKYLPFLLPIGLTIYTFCVILQGISLAVFSKSFLKLHQYAPRINVMLNFLILFVFLAGVFYEITGLTFSLSLRDMGLITITLTTLISSIIAFKNGLSSAVYFLIATIAYIVLGSICILPGLGLMPLNFISRYGMDIGAILMILLFSLGLTDQINTIRHEKEKAQQAVILSLKRIDRLKDEFLVNTSHELRTPLHAIINLTQSLIEGVCGKLSDTVNHNLDLIHTSGKRLFYLVNDILDFSKIKNNELSLDIKPIKVASITRTVLLFISQLGRGKNLQIENFISDDCPLVDADENRVHQILYNLIGNAVKFTEKGKITLTYHVSHHFLTVSIKDTGIGIADEKKEQIFDAFVHGHSLEHFDPQGGTGLGLTITKKLIELHGGTIQVQSNLNQGSCFTFTLPLSKKNETFNFSKFIPPDKKTVFDLKLLDQASPKLDQKAEHKILIVDDDPVNIQIVRNQLHLHNFSFFTASNGFEALDLIDNNQQSIDLVLLDVMMPGISGYQVCRKIREKYSLYELPVLMLTARSSIMDLVEGFDAGTNDYLTKPFNNAELRKRVNSLLSLRKLTHTNTLLKNTSELKSKIMSMAVHDIKNPISSINIYADLLLKKELVIGKGIKFVESIQYSSSKIQILVNELLENSRIKAGKIVLKKIKMDLYELIQTTAVQFSEAAKKKNIDIVFKGYQKPLPIMADRFRVEQIFTNLISNALKFSPYDKQVTIKFSKPKQNKVKVEIIDQGPGLTEEDKEKVFEEFQQLSALPTGNEISTGIGLSITKGLTELHNGKIWVESEFKKGADFIIELPTDLL